MRRKLSRRQYSVLFVVPLLLAVGVVLFGQHSKAFAVELQQSINFQATVPSSGAPGSATFTIKPKSGNTNTSDVGGSATVKGTTAGGQTTYKGTIKATLQVPGRECQNGGCQYSYQICSNNPALCSAFWDNANAPATVNLTSASSTNNPANQLPAGKVCPTGTNGTVMQYAGNNKCVADAIKDGSGKPSCANFPNAKLVAAVTHPNGGTSPATCTAAVIDASTAATDSCAIPDKGPGSTVLRWLACPVIEAAQDMLEGTGHDCNGGLCAIISAYLTTPSSEIFGTTGTPDNATSKAFYTAWNNFRILGIAIIVIAGLIMIVSEALGFDFVDAYTIRKVLPRLLIAAIVITLSWPILYFLINFFNDLGTAIRAIMITPFSSLKGLGNNATFGTILANWLTPLLAFAALGPGGLLSLVGTAALALLVALFILIIREGAIDILVITAPLWMALYVLPNTQKISHAAGDTLIRALAMFPIIMAFWTAGDILSVILRSSDLAFSSFASMLAGLLGPVGAVFAFRFAGGAVATIGGFVNDRSRGGFDRLKKYRQGKTSQNLNDLRTGDRFGGPLSGLNTVSVRAGSKNFGFGRKGRESTEQRLSEFAAERAKSRSGQAIQFNDDGLQAQTYANASQAEQNMAKDFGWYKYNADGTIKDKGKTDERVKEAIAAAKVNGGFGKTRQVFASNQLAATGTGYTSDSDEDIAAGRGKNAMQKQMETIARVTGGNKSLAAAMVGGQRSASERAGRNDLKASYGTMRGLADATIDQGGSTASLRQRFVNAGVEAGLSTDNATLMRNKAGSVEDISRSLATGLQNAQITMNSPTASAQDRAAASQQAGQITAKIENMQNAGIYGPEVNSTAVYNQTAPVQNVISITRNQAAPTLRASDVATQQPIQVPNNQYNPNVANSYNRTRQSRGFDPNDPRMQGPHDMDDAA